MLAIFGSSVQKALLDIELEIARKNIGEFTKSPVLAARNGSK